MKTQDFFFLEVIYNIMLSLCFGSCCFIILLYLRCFLNSIAKKRINPLHTIFAIDIYCGTAVKTFSNINNNHIFLFEIFYYRKTKANS